MPRVRLTTSQGDIVIELFENEAPQTVGNFVNLVEKKFYDGLTFHRVLASFMAQGGCPQGDGRGGPGYQIPCECYREGYRKHFRGSLSMAHAGRDTGGSQFFLTFAPTKHLDGKHTVFGRVIEGMDVLSKLQRRDPDHRSAPPPDKIIQAVVVRKRDHPYKPTIAGAG
ncbi:MAG: peptidylprolyl isomerase [Planctomycetales bacterium]|nr:peptidylprolyl isomerase [Planctomycetales bacterium]NIM08471.1 peptidylprolyl isomerase [Planctomycetales bacterium]NIN07951.1 peptidylprolyl isomerase [Planctomycetales bacterium]NIN77079.1 peptidylprolyl isomerase [Planctomycetales bacterium]NIO34257.1 peptidylprolyl isomerase [Planctomycetales bacterium]